jgi:hypothetical protein
MITWLQQPAFLALCVVGPRNWTRDLRRSQPALVGA